jgi:hypothetical protein
MFVKQESTNDLSNEIRAIERKIRQCQRKIEEEKKRKALEGNNTLK